MDIERRSSNFPLNNSCMIYSKGSIDQNPQILNRERVDSYESKRFVDEFDEMQVESFSSGTFDLLFNPLKDVNSNMISHTFSDELLLGAPIPPSNNSCHMESSQMLKASNCDSDSQQITSQMASFDNSSCIPWLFESSDWNRSCFLPPILDEDERVLVTHKTWQLGDGLQNLKCLPCYSSGLLDEENNHLEILHGHATNTAMHTSALNSIKQQHNPFVHVEGAAEACKQFGTRVGYNLRLNETSNFVPSFVNQANSALTYDPPFNVSSLQQLTPPFTMLPNQQLEQYTSPDYQRCRNFKQFINRDTNSDQPLRISYERNVTSFDYLSPSRDMSNNSPAADREMPEYPKVTSYSYSPSQENSLLGMESLHTNMYEEVLRDDSAILGENQYCKSSVTTPGLRQEGSRKRLQNTFSVREDTKAKRMLQLDDGNSTTLTSSSSQTSLRSCCNTLPVSKGDKKVSASPKESVDEALNTDCKPKLARQGCANDPQSIAARNRRERISERLKILQDLVPNGTKVDLVTMLEKAITYVKFLQLQVKVLATDEYWPSNHDSTDNIAQQATNS